MPVDSTHPDYESWAPRWKICRDVVAGEYAVKAAGETYLPKPSGQDDAEWKAYLKRAHLFPATGRTQAGLTGLVWRRAPQVEVPETMDKMLEDVTLSGVSIQDLAADLVEEVVEVGRAGLLVDYPQVPVTPDLSVEQQERIGARPFMVLYHAEDVVNWRQQRIGSRTLLTLVVLREAVAVGGSDPFKTETTIQYRALELTADRPDGAAPGGDPVYRVTVYQKATAGENVGKWVPVSVVWPVSRGQYLSAIPFTFVGVDATDGPEVDQPPLLDLAQVNLSHYRTMADLEHGAHWAGLPTPVFIGLTEDQRKTGIKMGSSEGITLPIGGDAKFLEFTAVGLQALEKRAEEKREEMVVLGARILAPEKRQPETREVATIHRAGENSVLASIANNASGAIESGLEMMRDWAGLSGDVLFRLNTDYLATPMDAAMLGALTGALQAGTLSSQDYFWYLQRGDVIRADRTYEEALADLENHPPMAAQIAAQIAANTQGEEDPAQGEGDDGK